MGANDASTQIAELAATLLNDYAAHIVRANRPFCIGLSGAPGCGKSTLATAMVEQAQKRDWPALALSLDDFYLSRSERQQLAAREHPLLATRGVPGTHDLVLLTDVMHRLTRASPRQLVAIPRFDKGRDTRVPPSRWRPVDAPPRVLILEGWCLGVGAQTTAQLRLPINALERDEDADGRWRRWVNQRLRGYLPLWQKLDARIVLQAPDWRTVCRWREQAEQSLRAREAPRAMDSAALQYFLQHYERIGRHALARPPAHAGRVFHLDASRRAVISSR